MKLTRKWINICEAMTSSTSTAAVCNARSSMQWIYQLNQPRKQVSCIVSITCILYFLYITINLTIYKYDKLFISFLFHNCNNCIQDNSCYKIIAAFGNANLRRRNALILAYVTCTVEKEHSDLPNAAILTLREPGGKSPWIICNISHTPMLYFIINIL